MKCSLCKEENWLDLHNLIGWCYCDEIDFPNMKWCKNCGSIHIVYYKNIMPEIDENIENIEFYSPKLLGK